jgi:hypothetical protein
MLASTVQFSNNDQPPITPGTTSRVHWGRHPEDPASRPCPQTPNSVPDTLTTPLPFHAEAVLGRQAGQVCRVVNVPPMSNQCGTFARILASDLVPEDSVRSAP